MHWKSEQMFLLLCCTHCRIACREEMNKTKIVMMTTFVMKGIETIVSQALFRFRCLSFYSELQ